VEISQLIVVETEQVENRGVDVLERVRAFDGFFAISSVAPTRML
jgi:hypothetical protein